MNSTNILEPIWRSYITTIDCLKISKRILKKGETHLMSETLFHLNSPDESSKMISSSEKDADDFVIVSMWALFEIKLFDYLEKERNKFINKQSTNLNTQVFRKVEKEMNYWRIIDILDLFKTIIDPELIGNAKQVKKYRDWVAHKNLKKGSPPNTTPQYAYKILSTIIMLIEQHPDINQPSLTS